MKLLFVTFFKYICINILKIICEIGELQAKVYMTEILGAAWQKTVQIIISALKILFVAFLFIVFCFLN